MNLRNPDRSARANDADGLRRRLARLAWLLDSSIPLPGGRWRIGLDPLLGLIPGLGDVLGVLLSSYIVREAASAGAPPSVLARMAFNVALEGLVGLIPLVGDLFDAAFKANQRNVALLDDYLASPHRTRRASRLFVGLVITALVLLAVALAAAAFFVIRAIWQAFV